MLMRLVIVETALIVGICLFIYMVGEMIAESEDIYGWFVQAGDFGDYMTGFGVNLGYTRIDNSIQFGLSVLRWTFCIGYSLEEVTHEEE